MSNKLFKSFFAFAMVLGAALGFVGCTPTEETTKVDPKIELSVAALNFSSAEESKTVEITCNSKWEVDLKELAEWITVSPANGKNNATITITVAENTTGVVRDAEVKVFALHETYGRYDSKTVVVAQSADEQETVTEELLYSDNFDGKVAEKGSNWPYIDQFPEFANPQGTAGENVTYTGSGVSVRANSTSNSNYSDYEGSGSNNIFFGGGAYFVINNIAPLKEGHNEYKLTFGTEKYTQDGDSTFKNDEFIVSLSKDGEKWAPIEYTFAGTEPGRWNEATANFNLTTLPEALYIKFEAKVASVYRLDDVKLYVSNGGQSVDLDNIVVEEPERPTTDALYYENFDGQGAVKDGSGYWPYIADFPEMVNAAGSAAATVNYTGYNATVRNNSNSDGTYSDYEGSGVNNIFFGKDNSWFAINELALESTHKNLTLTFGTEKYSQTLGSLFTPSEFLVSISDDGEKWSNVEYTFAGTAEGRWNLATANFTLAEVPAKLYIKFTATVESAYRLDDVTLDLGEGGQVIDLANGTTEEPEQPGTGDEPSDEPNTPANGIYESDSAFVCKADDSTNAAYSLGESKVNGVTPTGFKLGTGKLAGYFKSGVVSVEGAKYLNFYAVAWSGKSATLYYRVDGGEAKSVALNANVGAAGNPPYTITDVDADHYSVLLEGLTETSRIEFSTDASFTAASNTTSGRAVVFGVKLSDEPIGAETPSEPENPGEGEDPETPVDPENPGEGEDPETPVDPETPADPETPTVVVATVAEFLAAAEDSTIYELTGVIKNVANTYYGNFDLQDETGSVYVYGIYDEAGNKVFESLGLKEGDTLTMRGVRTSYKDVAQVGSGVYVSHIVAPEQEQPANEATLSFADAANRVSQDVNQQVWSANGITLTNNKGASTSDVGTYTAPARFYKSSELIVECDKAMAKIEFVCSGTSYATALESSITSGNVTVDGSSVFVTFDSAVTSYTVASLTGGQVRMNKLTVTYAE